MGFITLIGAGLGLLKDGVDWLLGRQKKDEREEYRQEGRVETERDQLEEGNDARDRMDAVDPADSDTVDDELRRHDY